MMKLGWNPADRNCFEVIIDAPDYLQWPIVLDQVKSINIPDTGELMIVLYPDWIESSTDVVGIKTIKRIIEGGKRVAYPLEIFLHDKKGDIITHHKYPRIIFKAVKEFSNLIIGDVI